jgi:hypothetical protein
MAESGAVGITVDSDPEWRRSILLAACDAPRCSFVQTFVGTGFLGNYFAALKAGWIETASGKFLCSKCKDANGSPQKSKSPGIAAEAPASLAELVQARRFLIVVRLGGRRREQCPGW